MKGERVRDDEPSVGVRDLLSLLFRKPFLHCPFCKERIDFNVSAFERIGIFGGVLSLAIILSKGSIPDNIHRPVTLVFGIAYILSVVYIHYFYFRSWQRYKRYEFKSEG